MNSNYLYIPTRWPWRLYIPPQVTLTAVYPPPPRWPWRLQRLRRLSVITWTLAKTFVMSALDWGGGGGKKSRTESKKQAITNTKHEGGGGGREWKTWNIPARLLIECSFGTGDSNLTIRTIHFFSHIMSGEPGAPAAFVMPESTRENPQIF